MAAKVGYRSLNVCFDNSNQLAPHSLLLKRHTLRKDDSFTPTDKTLFVLNIPPYCTKRALKTILSRCGSVRAVYIQSEPGNVDQTVESIISRYHKREKQGFGVAYVVFKTPLAVEKALAMSDTEVNLISTTEAPVKTGLEKWCDSYSKGYPDTKLLQNEVDKYMEAFDRKEKEAEEAEKHLQDEPDEEGWVTVTHGGRKPAISQSKTVINSNTKKQRKEKELLNFYQFQQRESHRDHIAQLRKKFEEDKKRIALMRAQRKFKPYS